MQFKPIWDGPNASIIEDLVELRSNHNFDSLRMHPRLYNILVEYWTACDYPAIMDKSSYVPHNRFMIIVPFPKSKDQLDDGPLRWSGARLDIEEDRDIRSDIVVLES